MPRDAAVCYQKTKKERTEFRGITRLGGSGSYYWVAVWFSSLQPLEGGIRFTPSKKPHPCTGQEPARNSKPVTAKLVRSPDGTHLEGCTKAARVEVWPRLVGEKPVLEAILSPANREEGSKS
jgi:hypothetical protein